MKKYMQAVLLTGALAVIAGCGGGEKKDDKPADKGAAPADGKTESAPPASTEKK
jgi:predicted small lipoprotein YifL